MTRRMFPGTVTDGGNDLVSVLIDPDETPTQCRNLTGRNLRQNVRVVVDFIEPGGVFIVGTIGLAAGLLFKGKAVHDPASGSPNDTATGSLQTLGFGEAGAFYFTPVINIGGFVTDESAADPEPLLLPRSGPYRWWVYCDFEGNAASRREIRLVEGASAVPASSVNVGSAGTSDTRILSSGIHEFNGTDSVYMQSFQGTGGPLLTEAWLTLESVDD